VFASNVAVPTEVAEITNPETEGGVCYTPRIDICETPEEFVMLCDLPGVNPGNLELEIAKDELSLHGKVPLRQGSVEFLTGEYGVGDFFRSFMIPTEVRGPDHGRIQAGRPDRPPAQDRSREAQTHSHQAGVGGYP
jgi:HSP20 family molecular chaperone IbpA